MPHTCSHGESIESRIRAEGFSSERELARRKRACILRDTLRRIKLNCAKTPCRGRYLLVKNKVTYLWIFSNTSSGTYTYPRIHLVSAPSVPDIFPPRLFHPGSLQFREHVVSCNFMRIARLYLCHDSRFACSRRRMETAQHAFYIKPLTKKGFIKNANALFLSRLLFLCSISSLLNY